MVLPLKWSYSYSLWSYSLCSQGHDCWVLEVGTVISSMLIPGIAGAGVEWKETRPYKPGKFGSFFGERGLRRGEPRPARMICRTDVKALRITQDNYVRTARIREYKENLLRSIGLLAQMTDEQIGKVRRRGRRHARGGSNERARPSLPPPTLSLLRGMPPSLVPRACTLPSDGECSMCACVCARARARAWWASTGAARGGVAKALVQRERADRGAG